MAVRVAPSFPFDEELRCIALAQALRGLAPEQVPDRVSRLFAYAAAGLVPINGAEDLDAVRRHRARPTAVNRSSLGEAA